MKSWFSWLLKAGLTGGILWALARQIDFANTWREACQLQAGAGALALLALLLQVVVITLRWRLLLTATGGHLLFQRMLSITYISLFVNLATPGTLGTDGVRIWMARSGGVPLTTAVNSVLLERLISLVGLLLMTTLALPWLWARMGATSLLWVFPGLLVASLAGTAMLLTLDRLPGRWDRWPLIATAARSLSQVAVDARRTLLRPSVLGPTMVLALLGHTAIALSFYFISVGIGAPVTVTDCLVLVPVILLLLVLPISIAGWGLREGAMVIVFGFIGVIGAQSLAISVLFGIFYIVSCLPGGILILVEGSHGLRRSGGQNDGVL